MQKNLRPIRSRRGFTLIELLVVIGIIAILASLLTAAAQKVRLTAMITQASMEISELSNAHQNFLQSYNLANKGGYFPSKIRLREDCWYNNPSNALTAADAALEAQSYTWLGLWRPLMSLGQGGNPPADLIYINWGARNFQANQKPQYFDLEGDQCLVFFLGGIPVNGVPTGFAKNSRNPAAAVSQSGSHRPHDRRPATFLRVQYEALVNRGGRYSGQALGFGTTGWPFPSYADPLSGIRQVQVYAYFTSYARPNSYNSTDCQVMAATLNLANCVPQLASTNPITFKNQTGFQIMSASARGDFAAGSFGPGS